VEKVNSIRNKGISDMKRSMIALSGAYDREFKNDESKRKGSHRSFMKRKLSRKIRRLLRQDMKND